MSNRFVVFAVFAFAACGTPAPIPDGGAVDGGFFVDFTAPSGAVSTSMLVTVTGGALRGAALARDGHEHAVTDGP